MKKIKKLALNKEVVSILGGNDMNLVKGGTGYSMDGAASCWGICGGNGGGSACPVDNTNVTPPSGSIASVCYICPQAPQPAQPVIQNPPPQIPNPAASGTTDICTSNSCYIEDCWQM